MDTHWTVKRQSRATELRTRHSGQSPPARLDLRVSEEAMCMRNPLVRNHRRDDVHVVDGMDGYTSSRVPRRVHPLRLPFIGLERAYVCRSVCEDVQMYA